jgi:ribosome-associated protein
MTNKELAVFAAKQLIEKKASDVAVLDISLRSGFADFFVIATAHSLRQLASLCDELDDRLTKEGAEVRHVEGKGDSGWILMDCGDVIVNLFTAEQREHYQIEKIWGDCERIEFEDHE